MSFPEQTNPQDEISGLNEEFKSVIDGAYDPKAISGVISKMAEAEAFASQKGLSVMVGCADRALGAAKAHGDGWSVIKFAAYKVMFAKLARYLGEKPTGL